MPIPGICDLTVFSHRGLSGDGSVDRPLLTEQALLSLASRGIRHFDLDLSFTADNTLLVAHPAAVVQEIGKDVDIFSQSLASLQRAAGPAHPPLLKANRLLDLASQHNLTIALDLKGSDVRPKDHASHLLSLAQRAVGDDLQGRVWLWADTADIARLLRRDLRRRINDSESTGTTARKLQEQMNRLTLVKAVRDRGLSPSTSRISGLLRTLAGGSAGSIDCSASQLSLADLRLFSMLGPSLRCTNTNLLAAPWARARWGVGGSWSRGEGGGARSSGLTTSVEARAASDVIHASGGSTRPHLSWMHPYTPHNLPNPLLHGATVFWDGSHRATKAGAAGLLVWVVDHEAELQPLLRLGVRNVISNVPLRLQEAARRLCAAAPRSGAPGKSTYR